MSTETSGRATDQAIAKIKELIIAGEFSAGSRLPREQDLAARLGLSRSSLREAVRALSLVGVLDVRVGDGTYVTSLDADLLLTGIGFVSDLMEADTLLEMHEIRRILEPAATRLATHRLTDEDFEQLHACVRRMESAESVTEFLEADAAFHGVILDACGNGALASLIQNLSSSTLRARLWQTVMAHDAVEATLANHRAIVRALEARDEDMAAAADMMHLALAEEWIQKFAEQPAGDGA
ncbi:MAG: FadR family transcriptional regulator [Actinobacteria bacterium]|nr:FadR family transcriptional regulator [Actinomycetota bacterium]MBV8563809.1 FadR family transcriptional regulator [Actinomycetota bacterium]